MLFGGYIFRYKIQTYIYSLLAILYWLLGTPRGHFRLEKAAEPPQNTPQGTREHAPKSCYFQGPASIHNIHIYIIYICIDTLFYFSVSISAFCLRTRFGPYLLFAIGFGAPFRYNCILEFRSLDDWSNF